MAAVEAPHYLQATLETTLSPDDFETASIRSAAPSYSKSPSRATTTNSHDTLAHTRLASDAPSYHSTIINPDPLPPYTPREPSTNSTTTTTTRRPSLLPSDPSLPRAPGLPPVPTGPLRNHHTPTIPTLGHFRIPSWTTISSPAARVALRRSSSAAPGSHHHHSSTRAHIQDARRIMLLDRIVEEESARERTRRLEDPYLVGEHAAAQARRERLARESSRDGDEVLIREDRRWDFFLGELSGRRARGGRLAMMR
ncbi:hypothetical protein QBC39DRAFT_51292 [Podospora conica]|nr:hypothetical protein QBC39DRAFT_51292 [Schizothecium conicum]